MNFSFDQGAAATLPVGALSDGLTLSNAANGGIVIENIQQNSPVARAGTLKKGDKLNAVTIHFDNLDSAEVSKILKYSEPYKTSLKLNSNEELQSPDYRYSSPGMGSDDQVYLKLFNSKIKPHLKLAKPDLSVDGPDMDVSGNNKIPSVGVKGPKISSDIGMNLKAANDVELPTNIDLNAPKFQADVKGPGLDIDIPRMNGANIEGKIKSPSFQNPSFSTPELPEMNMSLPKLKTDIKAPDIDIGGVNVPETEATWKKPKLLMPSFGLSGPQEADMNLDGSVKAPGVDVSASNVRGNFAAPNVDLNIPKGDIDVNIPDTELNKRKFKMPKFNMPSSNMSDPDLDLNLKAPAVRSDVDAKLKVPKLRNPSLEISGLEGPNVNLDGKVKLPKADIKTPEIKTGIGSAGIDLGKPTIGADYDMPDMNLDVPDVKLKSPGIKMPTLNMSGKGVSIPDVDANLPAANIDLASPKIQADVKSPNLDINAPNVDGLGAEGKFKFPKFKKPTLSISGNKLKGPDLKTDIKVPDADIGGLQRSVDVPETNAKLKMPNLHMPPFGLSGPKIPEAGLDGSVKAPGVNVSGPNIMGNYEAPKVNVKLPKGDIPDAEHKGGKFRLPGFNLPSGKVSLPGSGKGLKMPKGQVDLSAPDLQGDIRGPSLDLKGTKRPDMDLDGSVKAPGVDVSAPNLKGNFAAPNVDLNLPKVNIDANIPDAELNKQKFKTPKFTEPNLEMSGLEGPNVNLNGKVKLPKADIKAPEFKTRIGSAGIDLGKPTIGADYDMPGMNLDVPNIKLKSPGIKMPTLNMSGKGVSIPDVDANLPTANIDLASPKIQADVKSPNLDINAPNVDGFGAEGKFKVPKFKKPTFSISGNKLKGPDLKTDIQVPNADIGGLQGSVDVPETNAKLKMPNLHMPPFGLSGPKIPEGGLDGSVKAPGVDVSGPNIKGNYDAPNVDLKLPKGDSDANIPDADLKGGKFKLPGFNLPSGKLSLPGSGKGLKMPKGQVDLSAPDLQGDIRGPSLDLKGAKRPDMDLDGSVKAPGVNVSGPNIEGNYEAPNVDLKLPKGDIDANIPDAELKGGKFRLPGFNLPSGKLSLPGSGKGLKMPKGQVDLSAPDLHGDIRGPSLDLKGPSIDVDAPSIDVDAPSVDVPEAKGKWKMPKLEMPSFGLSGAKRPDMDLGGSVKAPGVDVSASNVRGNFAAPNVDLNIPKGDIDVNIPDAELNKQKLKMPKFNLPSSNLSTADLDLNLKAPAVRSDVDAKLKVPKLRKPSLEISGLEGPNVNLNGKVKLPKADIQTPEIKTGIGSAGIDLGKPTIGADYDMPDMNLDVPDVKLKSPGIKMPTLNMSGKGVSIPDVDANLPTTNIDLASPKIQADVKSPNLDINAPNVDGFGAEGKYKFPNFKKPTFSISGNKLKGPDVKTDIKVPDADIGGLQGSVDVPETNAKWKMPKLEMPSFGLSGPKRPDMDLDGSVKAPGVNVSGPNIKGVYEAPNVDLKLPKGDIGANIPDADLKGGKFRLPGFNLPSGKISLPGSDKEMKMPKGQVDLSAPDLQGDIRGPSLDLKGPSIDVDAPSVDVPEAKSKWKMPKLEMPSFGLSGPKRPDMDLDGLDMKGPSIDVNAPSVDVPDAKGKWKMPKFEMPSFGLSGPKRPDMDLGGSVKGPGVDASAPNFKGNFAAPNVDLNLPKVDIDASTPDAELNKQKFKTPKFTEPNLEMSGIEGSNMGLSGNVKIPKADASVPEIKTIGSAGADLKKPTIGVDFDIPNMNLDVPDAKVKGSSLNKPSLNMSPGNVYTPVVDIDPPTRKIRGDADILMPGGVTRESKLKDPNIDIKGAKVNVNSPNLHGDFREVGVDVNTENIYAAVNTPRLNTDNDENINMQNTFSRETFKIRSSLSELDDDVSTLPQSDSNLKGRTSSTLHVTDAAESKKSKFKFSNFFNLTHKSKGSVDFTKAKAAHSSSGTFRPTFPELELSVSKE
ncbi:hypothetical protein scyTo_0018414 [Scyliorhinus torazame]|uniref:PDZ domain-containing protein n=1 Tax=Scyliorhinus torazame TaxID=75743 RepID=A0A401PV64_SCYTO|nr:hypothetical protein [Scyliorhinus torazame]